MAASVAVLLGIGAWVTPASAATRCSKAGGTLAQTAGARVFVAQSNTLRRVFGCAAGQKNARSLGRAGGEGVDIVLSKKGTVAWISEEHAAGMDPVTARYVAYREPGTGVGIPATPVATGLDILPGTLALAGRVLYWTQVTAKAVLLP